jgi:hypothetical protein
MAMLSESRASQTATLGQTKDLIKVGDRVTVDGLPGNQNFFSFFFDS